MKTKIKIGLVAAILLGAGVSPVSAAISFGDGYYTNLCGTGTKATGYSCDPGCNLTEGVCASQNSGAVKYICSGNWAQCLENESGWSNLESMDNPGCGKTVQLSLFDKKCRRDDGGWDASCKLLGYMVWYSGVCRELVTPAPTALPANIPTATVKPTAAPAGKLTPTPTSVSKFRFPTPTLRITSQPTVEPTARPTVVPTKAVTVCNKQCTADANCAAGFTCEDRVCRNPSCPTDKTCFCGQVAGTNSGKLATPETGWPVWAWAIMVAGVGYGGLRISRWGRALWEI